MAKTFSTTTVPASISASAMPITVTTGMSALGRAWTSRMRQVSRPLERAVRRKSVFSTSIIDERIMRAMMAEKVVPAAIAGMMRCDSQGQNPPTSANSRSPAAIAGWPRRG